MLVRGPGQRDAVMDVDLTEALHLLVRPDPGRVGLRARQAELDRRVYLARDPALGERSTSGEADRECPLEHPRERNPRDAERAPEVRCQRPGTARLQNRRLAR